MFKANLFKLNRNKRYNYTPRYYQGKTIENLYDFDSKFNKYRETYNENDLAKQWQDARLENRNRSNRSFNPTLLVAIAVLTLIFLFIIDFDLSIFST
ncbi:MAG: hypothetical protein ACKVJM_00790 [Flavobacteriales bacterium]|jgi:hypothetical protein|nr:hypothetical protein [Flavobacteriaceae bacterium]MDO7582297.1 hypothetical protein [Flavobacteriaceae bacterium]MDO7592400.1 hypothetical protein [Flavobacteriaceae bacterium]MDO7598432.1 hypothetical protein [Flavobacteriaceae bacterium]MDO7603370.1 hypothetical protein [Flavobacteriaceae bacterium]|tara:strand:+ start:1979 stop:2269 length:291 start_codon:yes stop_codon:yes gene_type:complete